MEKMNINGMDSKLKKIVRNKIIKNKMKSNSVHNVVLEEILNEDVNCLDVDERFLLVEFYKYAVENIDLNGINWNNVFINEKYEDTIILFRYALNLVLNNGKYKKEERLHLPKELLEKILFTRFYVEGQKTYKVPIFNKISLENLDISELDFSNVIFDVCSFYKEYLNRKKKYPEKCREDNYKIFINEMENQLTDIEIVDEEEVSNYNPYNEYTINLSDTNADVIFMPQPNGELYISGSYFRNVDLSKSIGNNIKKVVITCSNITNTNLLDTLDNKNIKYDLDYVVNDIDGNKKYK